MLVPIVEPDPPPQLEHRFTDFYRTERAEAVRLAWLLTHDSAICDDIVQDAFTQVYQRFDRLDRPGAYLRVAIVNRARELGRSAGREHRRLRLVSAGTPLLVDGPHANATEGVTDDLAVAVARLPFPQRTAVVLRYWADLPIDEIAAALDVRPGSVRSMLSRAASTLRKELPR